METAAMATLCLLLNQKTSLVASIVRDSLSLVLILLLVRFVTLKQLVKMQQCIAMEGSIIK